MGSGFNKIIVNALINSSIEKHNHITDGPGSSFYLHSRDVTHGTRFVITGIVHARVD